MNIEGPGHDNVDAGDQGGGAVELLVIFLLFY